MRARTHTPSAAAEATVSFDSKTKAVRKRQDPSQHEICAFAIIGLEARQSRSTGSWLDDRDEQIDGRCHAGFIPETWTLSASLTVPMSLTHRHPHTQERHCLLKRSSLPDSLFSESILLEATQRTACQVDLDSTVSLSPSPFFVSSLARSLPLSSPLLTCWHSPLTLQCSFPLAAGSGRAAAAQLNAAGEAATLQSGSKKPRRYHSPTGGWGERMLKHTRRCTHTLESWHNERVCSGFVRVRGRRCFNHPDWRVITQICWETAAEGIWRF